MFTEKELTEASINLAQDILWFAPQRGVCRVKRRIQLIRSLVALLVSPHTVAPLVFSIQQAVDSQVSLQDEKYFSES